MGRRLRPGVVVGGCVTVAAAAVWSFVAFGPLAALLFLVVGGGLTVFLGLAAVIARDTWWPPTDR